MCIVLGKTRSTELWWSCLLERSRLEAIEKDGKINVKLDLSKIMEPLQGHGFYSRVLNFQVLLP